MEEPGRLQIECVNNILLKMIKEMCDCTTERPRKSHGSDYVLCRTKPPIGHKDWGKDTEGLKKLHTVLCFALIYFPNIY